MTTKQQQKTRKPGTTGTFSRWFQRSMNELPGGTPTPVTPQALTGADRDRAWQQITTAQPRYAKYQKKSDRQYPVIRLTAR